NTDIKVTFTTKGGKVKEVLLKNYTDHLDQPLILLDEQSSKMDLLLGNTNVYDQFFTASKEGNSVTFTTQLANGESVSQAYSLAEEGFIVNYDLKTSGFSGTSSLNWTDNLRQVEKSRKESANKASVNYYLAEGEFDDVGKNSTSEDNETITKPLKWVGLSHRFFNATIVGDNYSFDRAELKSVVNESDLTAIKNLSMRLTLPAGAIQDGKFKFYFGPNDYKITKATGIPAFEKNIYLGWSIFAAVNRFLVIPIFKTLEKFISNYGIIILILVIIIKTLLFPIAYRSYLSMAKMRELRPEMDAIKERLGDDQAAIQKENMALNQKMGVNPLAGCIPVVLQMPILLALFNFFPNSIELRHQSFLWAEDLSTYDSVLSWTGNIPLISNFYGNHVSLFTLLMTVSTIIYTHINNKSNVSAQGPMKSLSYIMPVMFMFILNRFSSGLTFYYFVSNLVTISQQLLATKFIDKEKIRTALLANKEAFETGKRKKSKFQQRLDDAMKMQEQSKKKK
ncbi:MAG: membrane protein insertase YidC, partial [Cyclobacteriaceae bacterium]